MKTVVNIKRTLQDFEINRVRATVDLLVENSYKEEVKDWLKSKFFSFRFFVKQKVKKGYGSARYSFIVKDQFEVKVEDYLKDKDKYVARRVRK